MSESHSVDFGFVQRELRRIEAALRAEEHAERRQELYAAQQALSWALEPNILRSPVDMLTGIPATTADCSGVPHPQSS